jgi:multidrug resistance efflux pump
MDKGLRISITEREICEHISAQFRKSVAKKSASTNDRKVLSKARVITSEDLEKLRETINAADVEKAAKAVARDIKKKLKEEKGSPIPKIERLKGRKKVTISDETRENVCREV